MLTGWRARVSRIASGYPVTSDETPTGQGEKARIFLDAGEDLPAGIVVTYYLVRDAAIPAIVPKTAV